MSNYHSLNINLIELQAMTELAAKLQDVDMDEDLRERLDNLQDLLHKNLDDFIAWQNNNNLNPWQRRKELKRISENIYECNKSLDYFYMNFKDQLEEEPDYGHVVDNTIYTYRGD